MKIIKTIIFSILILALSAYLALYYERNYRKLIRFLYEFLTKNKLSLIEPREHFHFPSGVFVSTFSVFILISFYLFRKNKRKQNIINLFTGVLILIISTYSFCYVDSHLKVMECPTCGNGERELGYDDINYDKIFIASLILTVLPGIITKIRNRRESYKNEN